MTGLYLSLGSRRLTLQFKKRAERNADAHNPNSKEGYIWGIFRTKETAEIALRFSLGPIALYGGAILFYFACRHSGWKWRLFSALGVVSIASGLGAFLLPIYWQDDCEEYNDCQSFQHNTENVPQKPIDFSELLYYSNYMANVLNTDKQIAVIGALAEGSSIRSIERITGVHRDTIMRLGVKAGQSCTALMDEKMRNLEGHPKTDKAYAWMHDTGDPEKPFRHVTVLHIHPALSPAKAVRAFIVQEFRNVQSA